jgi:hypothetical protein
MNIDEVEPAEPQQETEKSQPQVAEPAADDDEVMVTLGSSGAAVTEFNELVERVPDEPEDPLDH